MRPKNYVKNQKLIKVAFGEIKTDLIVKLYFAVAENVGIFGLPKRT